MKIDRTWVRLPSGPPKFLKWRFKIMAKARTTRKSTTTTKSTTEAAVENPVVEEKVEEKTATPTKNTKPAAKPAAAKIRRVFQTVFEADAQMQLQTFVRDSNISDYEIVIDKQEDGMYKKVIEYTP